MKRSATSGEGGATPQTSAGGSVPPLTGGRVWSANRLGLDYAQEAQRMGPPIVPIIDAHLHVNGQRAAGILRRVCDLFGVHRLYSQTRIAEAQRVRDALGDRVRFVAGPDYMSEDRSHAFREGFLRNIERWHDEFGARMVKFWMAPRYRDFVDPVRDADIYTLDSPWRVRIAEAARDLGMMFKTHIADPDTWFATKYADARKYGTKREQYEPLEIMLERFDVPWIAAHMGGWPENLEFLDGLLARHDNLYLDTSATKWMVRELSRHSRADLLAFLTRWRGRILFGSDIVTSDAHLAPNEHSPNQFAADQAQNEHEAFDLYASRYWALRTLFESDWRGPSPIADPDLRLLDPTITDDLAAPDLVGMALPDDLLRSIYRDAAHELIDRWWDEHA